MPYTVSGMMDDPRMKGLPKHAVEIFVAAFNAALDTYKGDESRAMATAWAAVHQTYTKGADGTWTAKETAKMAAVEFSVERPALLFEAGEYPDKELTVTVEDLDRLVEAHAGQDIPIKIEHVDTPLDKLLGVVRGFYRKGIQLWGNTVWSDEAAALADKAGCKSLSVAINRDKSGIAEVSWTTEPRIAAAQYFTFSAEFPPSASGGAELETQTDTGGVAVMAEPETTTIVSPPVEQQKPPEAKQEAMSLERAHRIIAEHNAAIASGDIARFGAEQIATIREAEELTRKVATEMEASLKEYRKMKADMLTADFRAKGLITRASEPYFRAIVEQMPAAGVQLSESQVVTFSQGEGKEPAQDHFARVFELFVRANGPVVDFRERLRQDAESDVSPDEEAMLARFGYTADQYRKFVPAEQRR